MLRDTQIMAKRSPAFDRLVSFHEAGHAVVRVQPGRPIVHVTIDPDHEEGSEGHMLSQQLPRGLHPDRQLREPQVRAIIGEAAVAVAGRAAARLTGHPRAAWGCNSDLASARYMLSYLETHPGDESPNLLLRWIIARVETIVASREPLVAAVADQLIEHRRLDKSALVALIQPKFSLDETARMRAHVKKFGTGYINAWTLSWRHGSMSRRRDHPVRKR